MTNSLDIIRIRSDDSLFIVNVKTINKFPESLFFKIINSSEVSDIVHKDNNTLYLDMRPENIKIIIDHMRGYKINTSNESIKMDFQRLGIQFPQYIDNSIQINNNIYKENLFIKQNRDINNFIGSDNFTEGPDRDFAKTFFEKLSIPKDNDTITSISELNNTITDITDTLYKLNNNNFKIIRPRKEKLDFNLL